MALRSQPHRLQSLSLCSGFGGIELGIKLAAPQVRTVCYVEREAYAAASLVRSMQEGTLDEAPVWDDVRTFQCDIWRGQVDLVTGGYPCQPFSHIGKKGGSGDERSIWPHLARIIRETEPKFVFCENVSAHINLGLRQVHDDLESMDYTVAVGLYTAAEVGAGHQRRRLFFLADRRGQRLQRQLQGRTEERTTGRSGRAGLVQPAAFPPRPDDYGAWTGLLFAQSGLAPSLPKSHFCGVADGMADRPHRLRGCGNGVVPAVAALALVELAADLGVTEELGVTLLTG